MRRRVIVCLALLGLLTEDLRAEVIVVVSASSSTDRLSRAALANIYLGRVNRLPNGQPVVPIDQNERSRAYEEFCERYLDRSPAQIKAHWSRLIFTGRGQPPRTVPDSAAAANLIAGNPHAIGYLPAEAMDPRLRPVAIE